MGWRAFGTMACGPEAVLRQTEFEEEEDEETEAGTDSPIDADAATSSNVHASSERRCAPSPERRNQPRTAYTLRRFFIFKTKAKLVILGCNKARTIWRVLSIDRRQAQVHQSTDMCAAVDVFEDPCTYSLSEATALLRRVHAGNASTGGAAHVVNAVAIVGIIRFLKGPYLVVITHKSRLGTVVGHPVYGVADTRVIQIFDATEQHAASSMAVRGQLSPGERLRQFVGDDAVHNISKIANAEEERLEKRYLKMFCELDMSNDFFFSYTFALANHLQANVTRNRGPAKLATSFESMFVWNAHLSRPLVKALGAESASMWLVPLVHGFFQQSTLSLFGRIFSITLISRRSRFFAGTRYHKRGVSESGYVANEVETEQIVDAGWDAQNRRLISSLVQLRGSVPLHWSQESGTLAPRPEITINRYDPFLQATRKHFERVSHRYGRPVVCLSLIKATQERHARESILHEAMGNAISHLNYTLPSSSRLAYVHYDFSRRARTEKLSQDEVLQELCSIGRGALGLTGVFVCCGSKIALEDELSAPKRNPERLIRAVETCWYNANASDDMMSGGSPEIIANQFRHGNYAEGDVQLQNGIVRTNCVDCLDRTNVAQCAVGMCALGQQLYSLGLSQTKELDADSSLVTALMGMYQDNGDFVAMQYGGSEAHHPIIANRRRSRELLTSMRRFYSNAYTDDEKQGAINLFLGNFIPRKGRPALWELSSDYYLHVHTKAGDDNDPNACEDVPFFNYSHDHDIKAEMQRLSADDLSGNEPKLRSFDKLLASRNELQHVRVGNRSLPPPSDEDSSREIDNSLTVAASFKRLRNRASPAAVASARASYVPHGTPAGTLEAPKHYEDVYNSLMHSGAAGSLTIDSNDAIAGGTMKEMQLRESKPDAAVGRSTATLHSHGSDSTLGRGENTNSSDAAMRKSAGLPIHSRNSVSISNFSDKKKRRRKRQQQYYKQRRHWEHDANRNSQECYMEAQNDNIHSGLDHASQTRDNVDDVGSNGDATGANRHGASSQAAIDLLKEMEEDSSNKGRVVAEYLHLSRQSFRMPHHGNHTDLQRNVNRRRYGTTSSELDKDEKVTHPQSESVATSLEPPLPLRRSQYAQWLDLSRLAQEWQAGLESSFHPSYGPYAHNCDCSS